MATVADQILRPLPMTRVANAGPGLAVGLLAIDAVLDGDLGCVSPLAVAGLAVGGFLAVKGYNVSVECAGQRVTVHQDHQPRGHHRDDRVPRHLMVLRR